MNFSITSLHFVGISEPFTLVNGQDERASPAVDKCVCPCLCGNQESESNECFRPHIVCFLISARIVLYHHRKYGHHLGTKSAKIIDFISVLIGGKPCICNGFHSSRLFDSTKSNTIFYCCAIKNDLFLWPWPEDGPHGRKNSHRLFFIVSQSSRSVNERGHSMRFTGFGQAPRRAPFLPLPGPWARALALFSPPVQTHRSEYGKLPCPPKQGASARGTVFFPMPRF